MFEKRTLKAGDEVLTLGYGSGDAAEVIPFTMTGDWREVCARIGFARAMSLAVDLRREQYEALHHGRRGGNLGYVPHKEFVIERVGDADHRYFSDLGIGVLPLRRSRLLKRVLVA